MSTLHGSTQGKSQKELLDNAKTVAVQYFGMDCVKVTVTRADADTDFIQHNEMSGSAVTIGGTVFEARYTAVVEHNYWQKFTTHGAWVCRHCDAHK